MADIERNLVCSVVTTRNWTPVMASQVTSEWFEDEQHREVFDFLTRHYRQHGEVPSEDILDVQYPHYRIKEPKDSLPALIDLLQQRRNYGLAVRAIQDAGEALEDDRDALTALESLVAVHQQMQLESSGLVDVDLTKTWRERLAKYHDRAENGGKLLGIPTGFKTVDLATSGWQRKQLVTVIATPKVGKSTLAMRMAMNAWAAGFTVLFISFEMSNEEQEARYDSMLAQIPHTNYMRGTLERNQLAHLEIELASTEGEEPFILSADINSVTTVSGIAAKIEQHRPDIVFVDGVYLMRDELGEDEGSPQALTNITRNLKRLAQRADIPIVSSTQALLSKVNKKRGVDATSIGYSSSFAQDSDVILGLQADDHDEDMRELRVVMSRNCGRLSTRCIWDWTTSTFEEADVYDEDDDGDEDDQRTAA